MHLVPVAPGLRLVAVNIAVLLSSSERATVPADQLLVGLAVVAENAEYDDCQTIPPEATTANGIAAPTMSFLEVNLRADMMGFLRRISFDLTGGPVIEGSITRFVDANKTDSSVLKYLNRARPERKCPRLS